MKIRILAAIVLVAAATPALAQGIDSARSPYPSWAYSGAAQAPVVHRASDPAYRFSGSHAGGPADALIPNGTAQQIMHREIASAYRYAGSHAGGPANGLARN